MTTLYRKTGASRTPIMLGKLLGEGAVGKVYAVEGDPASAVKLYHEASEAAALRPKIAAMLENPCNLPQLTRHGVPYPQIAWPDAEVVNGRGQFLGFTMPAIDLRRSTSLVNLLQKSSRRAEKLSDYYGYRVMVAHNLAAMFAELHRAGHHMVDMKPANLRVYPQTAWIAVVDTDGFAVSGNGHRHPAGQVSDDYIAPESWRRSAAALGAEQDQFALAVIVFQLLNNGVHPFAGRPAEGRNHPTDIQARILQGLYAYGLEPNPAVRPAAASIHKTFRRETRALFDQAFTPGMARPSAAMWRDHVATLLDQLTPCQANPAEHAHFGGGCGFCLYEAQVAAVAANARPRPVPPRAPSVPPALRGSARHSGAMAPRPGRPPSAGRSVVQSKKGRARKPSPARRPAPMRIGTRLRTAVVAGLGLGSLMVAGLLVEQLIESVVTPPAVGSEGYGGGAVGQPMAQINAFPMPLNYRLLPDRAGHGVQLAAEPGHPAESAEHVEPNERVTGMAETIDAVGERWIWVKRAGGGTGYVENNRLAQVSDLPGSDDDSDARDDVRRTTAY